MGDGEKIATKFIHDHAVAYAKSPQVDSARAWANLNIKLNDKPLEQVLTQVYGSGWAYGQVDAQQQLGTVSADPWADWKPGNEGAAALVDPANGLQSLLDSRGITVDGISSSMLDRIGTQLATSLSQGLGIQETASMVNGLLNDPARAMVIARTETATALIQSNLEQYRAEGVGSLEWLVGDPCDVCAENDGVIVSLGDSFPSGDTEPPAHPNCVCDVAPVVDEEGAVDSTPAEEVAADEAPVESVSPDGADNVIHDGVVDEAPTVEPEPNFDFDSAKLTPEQMDAQLSQTYKDLLKQYDNNWDRIEGLQSSSPNDKVIEELWKQQGFDALPALVTQEQMAQLVDQGWQPTFRGVAAETPELVQKFIDEYKTGDTPFGGKGMFGNGTYAASEATAEQFSKFTAEGKEVPHGDVMQMAINPEANYVDIMTLRDEWRTWYNEATDLRNQIEQQNGYDLVGEPRDKGGLTYSEWIDSLPKDVLAKRDEIQTAINVYEDLGKFATSRGYDGYYIENPQVNWQGETVQDTYYVILNRGTVAIVK
jgi:SPP1 gp7 family putative phage head morphogenesis protein